MIKSFANLSLDPYAFQVKEHNWRSTHDVFPIEFEGEKGPHKCVVKMPRMMGNVELTLLSEVVYSFQDLFSFNTRRPVFSSVLFQREAEILERINGKGMPKLEGYYAPHKIIFREYMEGKGFRELEDKEDTIKALKGGLDSLLEIHSVMPHGNAHVKKLVMEENENVRWTGVSGFYVGDEDQLREIDFAKFIYSTWIVTRDSEITKYSAELVAKVENGIGDYLPANFFSRLLEWYPHRMPVKKGDLQKDIRQILK